MFGPIRKFAVVLALLGLSACARTTTGPGFVEKVARVNPGDFTCCADPEKFYPAELINLAFALAPDHGPGVAKSMFGKYQAEGFPGKMSGNRKAEAALMEQLQPLDLVFTANKSYAWGNLIPGRFSHVIVYLGTEAQLKRAGLWNSAAIAPLRDDIRAGRLFIEAVTPKSQTTHPSRAIEADAAAILRPSLSAGARRTAYARLGGNLGVPYDYTFEVATTDRLSCTELVNLAMPGLGIRTRVAYGHTVIFPDEIVAQGIRGERMRVVGYMVGSTGGFEWRNTHSLMADIAAYWGLPGG